MSYSTVSDMTVSELSQRVLSLRQELLNLRLQKRLGRIENPSRMRLARREIARCLTVLAERDSASSSK